MDATENRDCVVMILSYTVPFAQMDCNKVVEVVEVLVLTPRKVADDVGDGGLKGIDTMESSVKGGGEAEAAQGGGRIEFATGEVGKWDGRVGEGADVDGLTVGGDDPLRRDGALVSRAGGRQCEQRLFYCQGHEACTDRGKQGKGRSKGSEVSRS